ncbi:putative leucine-rich repeat-containing protein [Schistosoma mansoni]|uniref:Putative leucine-rich repeat-containing protein n=1 Tax=Schistosoma mansoni TaxID=6183 RepID=G4VF95_SCHMA|nr:putative leucine-rich repeat-containing protein [Schistosoma mansoni]|eukprot:XP_018651213.1 putative leucine-rich repeat-containing protein [Schistosoma mansoni]
MAREWSIVSTALVEGRHELVISGKEISEMIETLGLDQRIYDLKKLNFLEISHTCLEFLSEDISKLSNLAQLCLTSNMLKAVPTNLGSLHCLRSLDLSFNNISMIPDIFDHLSNLSSLILSGNKIQNIPSVQGLKSLHEFSASKNQLTLLPEGIQLLTNLAVLDVSYNNISNLPNDLFNLSNLKSANFSENSLTDFPANIHRCRKLNVLKIHGNPFKDNRLKRLSVDEHSPTALLAYLRRLDETGSKKGKKVNDKNSPSKSSTEHEEMNNSIARPPEVTGISTPHIVIQRPNENEEYQINQTRSVKTGPRPYIVACTVHGVEFPSETKLRAFLRAQENWHRDIGQMRHHATLATHDLQLIRFPLAYTLKEAKSFLIHPLNRSINGTGEAFLRQLVQEAQLDRKSRKQTRFSQVYRYLNVLDIESAMVSNVFSDVMVPIVVDSTPVVISVPPLTNSHHTRLTVNTHNILIEVSGINLPLCKQFAEVVIAWLLENACPQTRENKPSDKPNTEEVNTAEQSQLVDEVDRKLTLKSVVIPPNALVVRPIRVVDVDFDYNLCVMFPSRSDLTDAKFNTIR